MDTPSVKSLTSSSNSSSSNTSSSSSANSSASNERRPTPKCKSISGEHDAANNSSKLNFKPYELSSRKGGDGSEKGGKHNRGSPSTNNNNNHSSPDLKNNNHSSGPSASTTTSSSSSSAPLSYTSLGLPDMHKDSLAAFYKAYGSFLTPGGCCPTTLSGGHSPYGHGLMPPPITLDKTGAYPSIYPPTHSATAAAALAAYNYSNYARVKSGAGAGHGHLGGNPLCRDPYCGGACSQYASHHHHSAAAMHSSHAAAAAMMAASQAAQSVPTSMASGGGGAQHQPQSNGPCTPATCPNGCNQCEQQRYLAAAAMAAAYGGGSFAGLSQMYPQMSASSYANSLATAAALHHRAATAAAAAGAGGTLCNWVVGDTHCGKRFATPEELLQHLKSHTSAAATSGAQTHQNGGSLEQSGRHGSPPTSGPSQGHSRSSPTSANNSSAQQHHQNAGTPSPHRAHSNSSSSGGPAVSPSLSSLHGAASNRYHPYAKAPSSMGQQQQQPSSNGLPQSASPYSMAQAAAAAAAAGYPFGLSPHGASMASHFPAANLYYPYMAPGLFSGRIGPPVPP